MARPNVGISGKGGSFSIADSATPTYQEYAMTEWSVSKEVESIDVTNFMSRAVNASVVGTAGVGSGSTAQAVQQVIGGVRKFTLEAKGYPMIYTAGVPSSTLFATRAEQDASVVQGVNNGVPNTTNPMIVGEKVSFRLGVSGGTTIATGNGYTIGPFEARITDFKYTNAVAGALEVSITAVSTAPEIVTVGGRNSPVGLDG